MHSSRLFVGLDTQDSVAPDMNQETTAFSQATELALDLAKMPCMAAHGVRPGQKYVLSLEPLQSLIVDSEAGGNQDWSQLQNFLYLELLGPSNTEKDLHSE